MSCVLGSHAWVTRSLQSCCVLDIKWSACLLSADDREPVHHASQRVDGSKQVANHKWKLHCDAAGGMVGMLALNGIFILVTRHGLEYPAFYERLYGLLTADAFQVRRYCHFALCTCVLHGFFSPKPLVG